MDRGMTPTERELRKRLAKMETQMEMREFMKLYAFARKLVREKQKR